MNICTLCSGIAHRDLKPENILCESPEKVLLWSAELHFLNLVPKNTPCVFSLLENF